MEALLAWEAVLSHPTFGDKFVVFPGRCDKCLFSSHAVLTANQSNHCTKVQLDKPMNLLGWLAQYGWRITYRSWGEPQTVVPHQCPTPARMGISWKLHHGVHCSVNLLFPMLCSISKILAGSWATDTVSNKQTKLKINKQKKMHLQKTSFPVEKINTHKCALNCCKTENSSPLR